MKSKKIVLVGGCFDILHPGHVIFLEKAKKAGDEHSSSALQSKLIVLLESDEKVKKLKGVKRPVHSQEERAQVLLALKSVDSVIKLPYIETEEEYDEIIKTVEPDIIALTAGADNKNQEKSAKRLGIEIRYVTNIVGNHSSSRILNGDHK